MRELCGVGGKLAGPPERADRGTLFSSAGEQFPLGGPPQVIALQAPDAVQQRETGARPVSHRHGHGAVERDDGRRVDVGESRIDRSDRGPVGSA